MFNNPDIMGLLGPQLWGAGHRTYGLGLGGHTILLLLSGIIWGYSLSKAEKVISYPLLGMIELKLPTPTNNAR